MSTAAAVTPGDASERVEARRYFTLHLDGIHRRADRVFALLLILQWLAMILVALVVSPRVWTGTESAVHPHVFAAIFVGAAIASLPLLLILSQPGTAATRHVVAVAQMLSSALLIHLTGGRIETHFHIFGSLAFLAFYRDVNVILTASAVVALDHWLRGVWWPQSVYGTVLPDGWRWLEHVGWVVFEDLFLILFVRQSVTHLREISLQRARQEADQRRLEEATREAKEARQALQEHADALSRSNDELQQFTYVASHDLKEPLRMVVQYLGLLDHRLGPTLNTDHRRFMDIATQGAERMLRLIDDLLAYTRVTSPEDGFAAVDLNEVVANARQSLAVAITEQEAVIEVGPLPRVNGSASLLGLLFQNLLGNALKFHEAKPPPHPRRLRRDARRLHRLGERQRHRHRPQPPRAHLPGLPAPAPRWALSRHRHRPGDLPQDRAPARRHHPGGLGRGRRLGVHRRTAARGRAGLTAFRPWRCGTAPPGR